MQTLLNSLIVFVLITGRLVPMSDVAHLLRGEIEPSRVLELEPDPPLDPEESEH